MYSQPAILTTMDITTDGFGFMLAVGDLLWVPFTYSLQARYLVFKQVELGPVWVALTLITNFTGYYIFRDANGEKNDFRNGRNPKSSWNIHWFCFILPYLTPNRFEILCYWERFQAFNIWVVGAVSAPQLFVRLLSTFWHIHLYNVLISSGDLIMALAWSLPTGFDTPITYFYVMYFAVLLAHRQHRDDENCAKKFVFSFPLCDFCALRICNCLQVWERLGYI